MPWASRRMIPARTNFYKPMNHDAKRTVVFLYPFYGGEELCSWNFVPMEHTFLGM